MSDVLTDDVYRFVRAAGPQPDAVVAEMDEYAEREGFPNVGPDAGGFLRLLARLADAERIFEFGSGFGYSAYWFAEALPEGGEIVLTEVDADELDLAREYLSRGGFDDLARYEQGDALETIERYDGPFDVVLIDHRKPDYVDAFEAVKSKIPVGGAIVADNAMSAAVVDFDALLSIVESRAAGDDAAADDRIDDVDEHTAGVAAYLERVRADPDFETTIVPVGEGLAVSYRIS
ncbi:O-methyltransferase [Halobacteria archaeon AArc-dxtr1]|nr:O-methyltransferase [Halobacteria archaeon AArc-dxtr1]